MYTVNEYVNTYNSIQCCDYVLWVPVRKIIKKQLYVSIMLTQKNGKTWWTPLYCVYALNKLCAFRKCVNYVVLINTHYGNVLRIYIFVFWEIFTNNIINKIFNRNKLKICKQYIKLYCSKVKIPIRYHYFLDFSSQWTSWHLH